jgi:hypothetical protein
VPALVVEAADQHRQLRPQGRHGIDAQQPQLWFGRTPSRQPEMNEQSEPCRGRRADTAQSVSETAQLSQRIGGGSPRSPEISGSNSASTSGSPSATATCQSSPASV